MTSLKQARAYLASAGKQLALKSAPVALLAVSTATFANASTFLGTGTCLGDATSGGITVVTHGAAFNGVTGVKGYGNCNTTFTGSGDGTGNMFVNLRASMGGIITGSVPGTVQIPVSWDFYVTSALNGLASYTYTVQLALNGAAQTLATGAVTPGQHIFQNVQFDFSGASTWNLDVNVQLAGADNLSGDFSLVVPTNSLDINDPVHIQTPEPASGLLAGLGGAVLFWLRRKRQDG